MPKGIKNQNRTEPREIPLSQSVLYRTICKALSLDKDGKSKMIKALRNNIANAPFQYAANRERSVAASTKRLGLRTAFRWIDTPEGYTYWDEVHSDVISYVSEVDAIVPFQKKVSA